MVLSRSLNDDRLYKMEQERSNLQQSLIQTSSHYDQLTSEKHGLTVALDDLRRMNHDYLFDNTYIFISCF